MELIGWLWWGLLKALGLVWSLAWFLLGGWVSTLAQIAVLVGIVFAYKYGWRQAPFETWRRAQGFARFFWSWLRAREPAPRTAAASPVEVREVVRLVRYKERGDVNASTLLSVLMLAGLVLMAGLK